MTGNLSIQKKLIEDSLPLKILGEYAKRERPAVPKTLSGLHIWWARRPLTLSRAIIAACILPAPKSERERSMLHNLIINSCSLDAGIPLRAKKGSKTSVFTYRSELKQLINEIKKNSPNQISLFDPFGGGGAIPFEALRLGLNVTVSDLNAVSYIIREVGLKLIPKVGLKKIRNPIDNSNNYVYSNLEKKIRKWGNIIINRAYDELRDYYEEDSLVYLWSKTCHCKTCGNQIPLHSFQYTEKRQENDIGVVLETNEADKSFQFKIISVDEKNKPSPKLRDRRGLICPFCKSKTTSLKDVKIEGKSRGLGYFPICKLILTRNGDRKYVPMSLADLEREKKAKSYLKQKILKSKRNNFTPMESAPPKEALGNAAALYGHNTFESFFTKRQLLTISTIAEKIRNSYEEIVEDMKEKDSARTVISILAFTLDRIADFNSQFSSWQQTTAKIRNVFSSPQFRMVWDFVETNPFSSGSGSWESALETTIRTLKVCSIPIKGDFENLICSATNVPLEDEKFDLVITDPPYYDYIGYADLSDYFYVWLKKTVNNIFPDAFKNVLTIKSDELILSAKDGRDINKLEANLLKAWKETERVLKPDGILVVMFTHKSTEAWEKLFSTLHSAGFYATATWPVLSERPTKTLQNRANVNTTLNVVCRKRSLIQEKLGTFKEIKVELEEVIQQRCKDFWNLNMYGSDFFVASIGPAMEVFAKYKQVIRINGKIVTIGELISFTREIVSKIVLEKLLAGTASILDHRSRIYVLWRWAYLVSITSADDLITFLKGVGGEREELEREKRIKLDKSKVSFLGPFERKKELNWSDNENWEENLPLIDHLHIASLLREKGSFNEFQNYLKFLGVLSQPHHPFWKLTRSLVEILQPLQSSGKIKTKDGSRELEAYRKILGNIPSIDIELEKKKPIELDKFLEIEDK